MQTLPTLSSAVADAYRAFAGEPAPALPLAACVGCCMSVDDEAQMRQWPLKRLTRQHFYSYNDAAKPEEQPAAEMRYLMPRMLELLAEGQDIHHSTELFMERVGRCAAGSFDAEQRAALDRFALAYFDATLTAALPGPRDDALSVLLMFHIGGIGIQPLLDDWLARDDAVSTAAYVEATYWNFWDVRDHTNSFSFDHPAFRQQLADWMFAPAYRARFVDKLLRPDFQQLAVGRPMSGCMPFTTLMDGVFDQLTS